MSTTDLTIMAYLGLGTIGILLGILIKLKKIYWLIPRFLSRVYTARSEFNIERFATIFMLYLVLLGFVSLGCGLAVLVYDVSIHLAEKVIFKSFYFCSGILFVGRVFSGKRIA